MAESAEKLERLRVEALDEILGVPFKVLDDGFVRVRPTAANRQQLHEFANSPRR